MHLQILNQIQRLKGIGNIMMPTALGAHEVTMKAVYAEIWMITVMEEERKVTFEYYVISNVNMNSVLFYVICFNTLK